MKKYTKRVFGGFLFLLILFSVTFLASKTLIMKRGDGITSMQGIYSQQPDTIDVLILGSSRAGMNISVEELWTDYGISSYTLWGSIQPFWNTYYFLKEALKTQNPKVIVLDVFAATRVFEYSDDARQITNIEGMNFNKNKIDAIKVSAPKERWHDLLWGFPVYHSRFGELQEQDYKYYPWSADVINNKGNGVGGMYGTDNDVPMQYEYSTSTIPLFPKEEEYLRKIVELCEKEKIPLVLISTPSESRQEYQPYFNEVNDIAKEYGIPYINYDKLDAQTGIVQSDFWTDHAHLNTNGSRKVAKNLGEYLVLNYDLADHRGDTKYLSWDIHSRERQNLYISTISNTDDYLRELLRDKRTVFVIQQGENEKSSEYDNFMDKIKKLGNLDIDAEKNGIWVRNLDKSEEISFAFNTENVECDNKNITLDFSDGEISIDNDIIYTISNSEIVLVIYDTEKHSVIDLCFFRQENDFQLERQEIE